MYFISLYQIRDNIIHMGLKEDFKQFRDKWKGTSISYKLMMILSIFISISSLASLSDVIFKWQGFIQDGINFYRFNISFFRNSLQNVGIDYQSSIFDFILSFAALSIILVRSFWLIRKEQNNKMEIGITTLIIVLANLIIIYSLEGPNLQFSIAEAWIILIVFLVSMLTVDLLFTSFSKVLVVYSPIFTVAILFLILSAINKGLSSI